MERLFRIGILALVLVGIDVPAGAPALPRVAASTTASSSDLGAQLASAVRVGEDVRSVSFQSEALGRPMPYLVYLPPGYETTGARYPALYMLHGMGGSASEWSQYGIFSLADRMIRSGALTPMIIVLPQGDRAYWVDHAGTDTQAWGRYMARDVVADVDARFRTEPYAPDRAIGGDSMGAHGALQLAINYPGTFSIVGAHSLVLRRYGSAPSFFGDQAQYAQRDPMQLAQTKTGQIRDLDLWIDIGSQDPWAPLAETFDRELNSLRVAHVWHLWPGDHSGSYWSSHLADYLRFYSDALVRHLHRPRPLQAL